ncbi:unnamed protein product [Chondrus crispus]|uniref:Uncharacterized protein n=1 Tax=Chondrus crispus TaxID=2769 RepID=R7Q242_CHOCR|nr:unnamed protein product [Chondrus crispus]CDF32124.1 unnamed protein product [Chondrus crispus]|eukprot:XP_005711789.1 unnamed protein product [Chondrus crispus]
MFRVSVFTSLRDVAVMAIVSCRKPLSIESQACTTSLFDIDTGPPSPIPMRASPSPSSCLVLLSKSSKRPSIVERDFDSAASGTRDRPTARPKPIASRSGRFSTASFSAFAAWAISLPILDDQSRADTVEPLPSLVNLCSRCALLSCSSLVSAGLWMVESYCRKERGRPLPRAPLRQDPVPLRQCPSSRWSSPPRYMCGGVAPLWILLQTHPQSARNRYFAVAAKR